jgi:fluoride exporter
LQKYLFIALGGALGSVTRFWIGTAVADRMGTKFPYGTFVINLSACLIIGFLLPFMGRLAGLDPAWRFLLLIGFIGAYSTFSTFEWEAFSTLHSGAFLIAALYVGLSVILGLVAVWCGSLIAKAAS